MPIRRSTDPKPLQHVWDAIRSANSQKQMADFPRIIRYLQRVDNCTPVQAELYLKQSLDDGLVLNLNKTTVKGAKLGLPVESYKVPNYDLPILLDDGKDWYCVDCHLAGDVIECRICCHVYHMECANKKLNLFNKSITNEDLFLDNRNVDSNSVINNNENKKDPITLLLLEKNQREYDLSLCSVCNLCKIEHKSILDKEELNYLLGFVLNRIKSWLPLCITDTMSSDPKPEWLTDMEINWRAKQLFRVPMSMRIIESKIHKMEYKYLVQFKMDVLTLQHNVAIYHGIESQEYGAAEYMLEDCRYDLAEISNCPDCYKHSNEKINNKWFCLPCKVPHKLVWAKQKGYPYWPAKVMKETESTCDVRFFGGKYERSILPKMYIKPITTKVNDVQSKKGAAFNKAVSELTIHQKMLDNPTEAQLFITLSRKKNKHLNKLSNAIPIVKITKLDTSKKYTNAHSYPTNDDIFDQSAQALEESLIAQASVAQKRKRSTSPSTKVKVAKLNHTAINKPKKANETSKATIDLSNVSSDVEDLEVPFEDGCLMKDSGHEEVTSSTEQIGSVEENCLRENSDGPVMPEPDRQYSESVEKTRRKMELCHNKKQLINVALECMQAEIDHINNLHDDYVKKLFEIHNAQISETKRKQWCYNCEQDAIYHCCWNTAYCSPTCQQQHWQAEHKKVCRRKR